MALPEDFSKIYGSTATGGLTPISDVNYAKGWEFVGSNPPTKNDFSYLQNLSDQKSQWLYSNKLQRTDPFGDIKSDGAVQTALTNLGLGAGAPAIGIPFFWPSAAMPNTVMDEWSDMVFLKFNGAAFSAATYPKLALVFPGLVLPEVRGEFLRVWDDGRGVDTGRALLSAQGSSKIHEHLGQNGELPNLGYMTVADSDSVTWDSGWSVGNIPNFSSASTGSSLMGMRPRNVAFNFLVRAK